MDKEIEITPLREAILAAAARGEVSGDEFDPDLTALHMAGLLRLIHDDGNRLVITETGLARLKHEPR